MNLPHHAETVAPGWFSRCVWDAIHRHDITGEDGLILVIEQRLAWQHHHGRSFDAYAEARRNQCVKTAQMRHEAA